MFNQNVKFKYLVISLFITAAGGAQTLSARNTCVEYYRASDVKMIHPTVLRTHDGIWNLEHDLVTTSKLAIPSRWRRMVENNSNVRVRSQEKIFKRKTQDGKDYTVSYFVYQPQSGKYKSTVVLQHGFAESSIYFKSQIRILVAMGFRVIAMDGANSGNTLLYTLKQKLFPLQSPSPVEDGRALAEIMQLELKSHEKFIILGHSRGFLVTSLALGTGLFNDQLIRHISSNGYDVWKIDEKVDEAIDTRMMNFFRFVPVLDKMTDYFISQMRSHLRYQANQMASPLLRDKVANHQVLKSREDVGTELADATTRLMLTNATMEVANGLKGADTSRPGIETIPLYDSNANLKDFDNGFGFEVTNSPLKIKPLADTVKEKTVMVFGDSDQLISMSSSRKLIDQVGYRPVLLGTDKETKVPATHFLPSERPFDLIELILEAQKSAR